MNYDTRMKPSYDQAIASQVVIAKDENSVPVGYIFSTIESVSYKDSHIPEWASSISSGEILGFYPKWDNLPAKTGCVNNLYLRKEYQRMGLGKKLMDTSMEWFRVSSDIDLTFVYISNGNDGAMNFYKNYGFTHSHKVFGGFIYALYKRLR